MSDQAVIGEWRQAMEQGRFDEAYRIYLVSGRSESEPEGLEKLRALAALADVLQYVRERAWLRARQKLERLEDPPPLLDWKGVQGELVQLQQSSEALEQREAETAMGLLSGFESRWFAAEAVNQRGTARIYLGEFEVATDDFARAVELDPRHFRALTNLGNAHLEAGRVDEAIACYQQALAVNDEFANAHHNLGVALRRQGKIGASVKHLRRAQRVQQRVDQERARERIGSGGQAGLKALRWSFIALGVLVLYVLLSRSGYL